MQLIKSILVLFLAASQLAAGQDFGFLPACGKICLDNVEAQFGAFGCANAADMACLCTKDGFQGGIQDCANQGCSGAQGSAVDVPLVESYKNSMCAAATAPPAPSSSAPEVPATTTAPAEPATTAEPPATTTEAPPTTSEQPATTAVEEPSSTSSVASETKAAESSSTSSPSVSSTTLETAPPTVLSSATPTGSTDSSTTTEATGTSSTTASETSSGTAAPASSQSKSTSPSGISIGAIAGISAGGAAVLLAALIIVFLRCRRARSNKRSTAYLDELKISEPMPGAGRYYGQDLGYPQQSPTPHSPSSGTSASELELLSRRYEDMVPRHAPKLIR